MKRVLQVMGTLEHGGAETMIMNLYRHIDREIIQFDFINHNPDLDDYEDEIRRLGGRVYYIPKFRGINYSQYVKAWKMFFAEHPEYEIIHGHVRSTAVIYLSLAKKLGRKTIAHSHNVSSGHGITALGKNILQLPIRFVADDFFACSKSAGEWLFGKRVVRGNRFHILPNAIDAEKYRYSPKWREELRKELKLEGKTVIGHVGRFHPQKNHGFLLDIFDKVHRENPDTVLLLIGEGDLRMDMEVLAKKKGLEDCVLFLGMREDVPQLLMAMDLFVFPSKYEGLGIVAIEAQASGLRCICSDAVPRDVKVTNLVQFLPLSDPDVWVDQILRSKCTEERKDRYQEICDAGYEISHTAAWLQNYYLENGDPSGKDAKSLDG